ncbi:MAG TPA: phosphoadenylyl-sulfate reductase [Candidatus Angelobacter sp.]|nr:phosphoadenylyl-sulfate reductase [Candidatus Angelobacter sp.]
MSTDLVDIAETLSAEVLLDRVLAGPGRRACITCSFQAEDMVVLHMLRQHRPDIPVLFLDTGYHSPDTYTYRDRMAASWNLNLLNVIPNITVADQEAAFGILHQTDPGRCCHLRKVEPLMAALKEFELWFTGLRRDQSPTRKNLKKFERHRLPEGKVLDKVNPLADWNSSQVWDYMVRNAIESLPLYAQGYASIGCEPCTAIPLIAADVRSGRWGGRKLECGIHTFSKRED